jgi:hypothetical protein
MIVRCGSVCVWEVGVGGGCLSVCPVCVCVSVGGGCMCVRARCVHAWPLRACDCVCVCVCVCDCVCVYVCMCVRVFDCTMPNLRVKKCLALDLKITFDCTLHNLRVKMCQSV